MTQDGSKGVRANQTPKAIRSTTPETGRSGSRPRGIFEGKGGKLNLRYAFKASATIKADVPFRPEFGRYMREEAMRALPAAVANAMRTRRS